MKIKALSGGVFLAVIGMIGGEATTQAQAEANVSARTPVYALVQPGDSLSKIAKAHSTTYMRIYDANKQIAHPDVINAGERVRIPFSDEKLASRQVPVATSTSQKTVQPQVQRSSDKVRSPVSTVRPTDGSVWQRLAQCESGGNPAINTGNGYYGAYQFSASTWRSVGGAGLPHQASFEEQTARAQQLQARSGWGQWPACSSKLGLR